MEEVSEYKYLGTVLYKHGSKEEEVREKVVKGKCLIGALERNMKRSLSLRIKKA